MKSPPAWLAAFHRRWQAARGKRKTPSARPFGLGWPDLMETAGIVSAEDESTALREAEALGKDGRLVLKYYRHRRIERVVLPVASEGWLHGLFGTVDPAVRKDRSMEVLRQMSGVHPRWPDEWKSMCSQLREDFAAGRNPRPFSWHYPERLRRLLEILWKLAEREGQGEFMRDVSSKVADDSKKLGHHRRSIEAGLAMLFGCPMSLEDLGVITSESFIHAHGPLVLDFGNGSPHETRALGAPWSISYADLRRAVAIRTTAMRLLTVENHTTFRQLAAADPAGSTLIVTSSFSTPALRELLAKLPLELPHHHFGDTDPTGWEILRHLRAVSPRPVHPFLMGWRPASGSMPLTPRDRDLLTKLFTDAEMTDCHGEMAAIRSAGHRGDFEQESLGPPDLGGWPFFSHAPGRLRD